ncbi:MAG: M42 family metallopeptidase [Bacilli bacterium]|jgi:endoglucanase|nr:M42 family metallopeptidase [Bacilli bacterium]HHU24741.1 M42 family metallopeptidase [Acholeplasmataceae bacterium]
MDDKLELLKRLTETPGISGFEKPVRMLMKQEFENLALPVRYDNLGSIVATINEQPSGPKIALAGHMDEIGFVITKITDKGYLKFQTVGGWWSQVMLAQQYDVHTADGKKYRAVMGSKPPHLLSNEERSKTVNIEKMYLDIGVKDKAEVDALGIKVGDMVTPAIDFQVMANPDYLLAKAFDDRIGCAIVIDVLKELKNKQLTNTVYGIGTVQEEVGLRGARTSAQMLNPDVVFAVDVTVATDTPDLDERSFLGKGPAILIIDGALIGHSELRKFVTSVAEELKIPYQLDYLARGGTDAGSMHLAHSGAPAMSLCIPARYIHSHTSIISRSDYENTVKLLVAVVERLDKETVKKITFGE